jgi:hypothetical protein
VQTHGGAEAEAVIASPSRTFLPVVTVDWNDNGLYDHAMANMSVYVSTVQTDRALKGSAPDEILLIEGSSAASMTVTLGGTNPDGVPLVSVFSPYNGTSPLYNKAQVGSEIKFSIILRTVLGTVEYPQFVGNITTITPDRGDNTVTITALDRVEKLRKAIVQAPWAVSDYWVARNRIQAQWADPQGFMDDVLRVCDVSTTRYRPTTREEMNVPDDGLDGVGLFVPGSGTIVPSIGWVDMSVLQEFPNTEVTGVPMYRAQGTPHPSSPQPTKRPLAFSALGTTTDGHVRYIVADRTLTKFEGTHYFGFVMNTDTSFPNGAWHVTAPDTVIAEYRMGGSRVMRVYIGANKLWTTVTNETNSAVETSVKVTIPTQSAVDVAIIWECTNPAGSRVSVRVGATATGWQTVGVVWGGDNVYDEYQGRFEINHTVSLSDIVYCFRNITGATTSEDTMWRQAKYVAILDQGLNTLSFSPPQQGAEGWSILTDIAAAEMGSVFWDETGVFRFWNYNTLKTLQLSNVRELTLDDIEDLEITNSLESVRNIWSVQVTKRTSTLNTIYAARAAEEFYVEGSSTRTFEIFVDNVQAVEPRLMDRFTKQPPGTIPGNHWPQWNDDVRHGYSFEFFNGGVWKEPNNDTDAGSPFIITWLGTDGVVRIRITNPWLEPIRFSVGGEPTFHVDGTLILDSPDVVFQSKDRPSILKYGPRTYEVSGDWYQEYYDQKGMMPAVVTRTAKPIPTTDRITIAGDPRTQLGDCFTVRDPEGFGETLQLQVLGINRKLDVSSGLTDTLSVELIKPAGVGIWDSPQYGLWDQSFIWS